MKIRFFISMMLFATLFACVKTDNDIPDPKPIVAGGLSVVAETSQAAQDLLASSLTISSATVAAAIKNDGKNEIIECGIYFSKVKNFSLGEATKAASGDLGEMGTGFGANNFSVELNYLDENTTYYYRFYVVHSKGTSYSELSESNSFTTKENLSAPTVSALNAPSSIDLALSTATISCQLIHNGYRDVTECGIYISTSNTFTASDKVALAHLPDMTTFPISYTVTKNNLVNGTTYYYKAYAVNSKGEGVSDVYSFDFVRAIELPVVDIVGSSVTDLTKTSANVKFKLISKGFGAISEYGYYINGVKNVVANSALAQEATFDVALTLTEGKFYTLYGYAINEDGATDATTAAKVSFRSAISDKFDNTLSYIELPGIEFNGNTYRFLDRNLGASARLATGTKVPTGVTGAQEEAAAAAAQAGWLFQLARPADGHQVLNPLSTTIAVPTPIANISGLAPLGDKFAMGNGGGNNQYKWISKATTDIKTWWSMADDGGPNNPCPAGYRVPSYDELVVFWNNREKTYIPRSIWFRGSNDGVVKENATTQGGWYWSCDVDTTLDNIGVPLRIVWSDSPKIGAKATLANNAAGMLVRCVSTNLTATDRE